jgi:hypothetical protein
MRIRFGLSPDFAFIMVFSLLGFAGHADQDYPQKRARMLGKVGSHSHAKAADATSQFNYSVLYSFCAAPNCTDGSSQDGGLIRDAAGNLYGTMTLGGANLGPFGAGGGVVFKLDPTGHETVLYNFCSVANCADGSQPKGGVIQDAAGNLYGATL